MLKFRLLFTIACFCVMATAAWATKPTQESTRFFKTHPNEIDVQEQDGSILFANRQVGLELQKSKEGVELIRLYGIAQDQDFLTAPKASEARNVFEIRMALDPKLAGRDDRAATSVGGFPTLDRMATIGNAFVMGSQSAKSVSWRCEKGDKQSVLHLEWKGMDVREDKGVLDVEVTVTLRAGIRSRTGGSPSATGVRNMGSSGQDFQFFPWRPLGRRRRTSFSIPSGEAVTQRIRSTLPGGLVRTTIPPARITLITSICSSRRFTTRRRPKEFTSPPRIRPQT